MTFFFVAAGLALAGFVVDRLLLWMEWRGWIDYRRTYPGRIDPGAVGPAFLAIQGLIQPDRKSHHEQKTAVRTEKDDRGELPDPGEFTGFRREKNGRARTPARGRKEQVVRERS
jgi:hypothetical protein